MTTTTSNLVKGVKSAQFGSLQKQNCSLAVYDYYRQFTNKPSALHTALIQNIFAVDLLGNSLNFIASKPQIKQNLQTLERLKKQDPSLLKNWKKNWEMVVLFLVIVIKKIEYQEFPPKKSLAQYALDLLEKIHLSKLNEDGEDLIFNFISPGIYNYYYANLKPIRQKSLGVLRNLQAAIIELLNNKQIKHQLQTRCKTIYSTYRKILKKNLLLEQVADLVGIRVITNTEANCYLIMQLILANWPISKSKIKDYISLPKSNHYQSLHLPLLLKEVPIEIQIRTIKMHREAEYGRAAHFLYK
jgi:hypothetical protein